MDEGSNSPEGWKIRVRTIKLESSIKFKTRTDGGGLVFTRSLGGKWEWISRSSGPRRVGMSAAIMIPHSKLPHCATVRTAHTPHGFFNFKKKINPLIFCPHLALCTATTFHPVLCRISLPSPPSHNHLPCILRFPMVWRQPLFCAYSVHPAPALF